MKNPKYNFLSKAGKIQNARLTSSFVLSGNVHDLFFLEDGTHGKYIPLIDVLSAKWNLKDRILVVYQLNAPIKFVDEKDQVLVEEAWMKMRYGLSVEDSAIQKMINPKFSSGSKTVQSEFVGWLKDSQVSPAVALELLKLLCRCSRSAVNGEPILEKDLIVIIERADLIIPEGEISRLSDTDRHRISICHNWFSDYGFLSGNDTVVMVAESKSLINNEISTLPQIIDVEIESPNLEEREHFIEWFNDGQPDDNKLKLWSSVKKLAELSAGLSIHALRQLLVGACYDCKIISPKEVVKKVEEYIKGQLGEDMVEFKKPTHKLNDCVGFSGIKHFFRNEMIPRMSGDVYETLSGVIITGPIGGGKTYLAEGAVSELDMVVLVLKNIRSQFFGQTDVLFERIRRIVKALNKVAIFLDEADTQLGGVSLETHTTEKRLTGKIQAMMSDSELRGKVFWILMTARIHLLSPDIRRPGRAGDMIIPILDPKGQDRDDFVNWMLKDVLSGDEKENFFETIRSLTEDYSAASFASLKSELKSKSKQAKLTSSAIVLIINDHLSPAIGETRKYQELQALINCTRKSLLPNPDVTHEERLGWMEQIRELEQKGIR